MCIRDRYRVISVLVTYLIIMQFLHLVAIKLSFMFKFTIAFRTDSSVRFPNCSNGSYINSISPPCSSVSFGLFGPSSPSGNSSVVRLKFLPCLTSLFSVIGILCSWTNPLLIISNSSRVSINFLLHVCLILTIFISSWTRSILPDILIGIASNFSWVFACISFTPVSYTHLDVYKRQLQP